MSSKLKAWHRYWQRDLENIGNMAKPGDTMTREQVLEGALRTTANVLKRRANASAWHNDPLIYDTIRNVVEPALASTGHDEPYDPQVIIAELQKRIAELEAGNAELQKWLLDKEYQRDAERQRREEAEAEIIRLRGMFVL